MNRVGDDEHFSGRPQPDCALVTARTMQGQATYISTVFKSKSTLSHDRSLNVLDNSSAEEASSRHQTLAVAEAIVDEDVLELLETKLVGAPERFAPVFLSVKLGARNHQFAQVVGCNAAFVDGANILGFTL